MEIIYIVVMLVMSLAVSLGVGTSTVTITQFFVAIKDGNMNDEEKKMMSVNYILLRVAMVAITATLLIQAAIIYQYTGDFLFISPFFMALYTVIAVLIVNAVAMTMHYMPRQIGPALQASSWYALGILMALVPLNLAGFAYPRFLLVYAGGVLLAVAALNIGLKHIRK